MVGVSNQMILQSFTIPNYPYDRKHLQFKITIPKNIAKDFGLKDSQTVYIINEGTKKINIHLSDKEGSTPITVSKNRTRIYKEKEYFTTRVCIPLIIIKNCKLEKQDDFYFETTTKNTITMHKIPEE